MSANLLGGETSPYLLLHKDNPVHWRPWSQDALAEAEAENKPILLSIGYTACHWCHVMNAESFADPATAEIMNSLFINVIVDREERPDIDQLYQTAANQLGHAGGWPLTMILTPGGEPFHAGTYYLNTDRPNQPSFRRVIEEIAKLWRENHESVTNSIARVSLGLANLWSRDMRAQIGADIVDQVAIHAAQRFDIFYGGVTGTPKFPSAGLVDLCWRGFLRTAAPQFFQVVSTTLDNICLASIYDHLGGGFSRYVADERWMVPHFEKMLWDNALMVDVMTSIWRYHRHTLYRERIEETIDWVLRDMKVEGGFASSLGADTEGEEGKYYVWTEAEIDAALMGTFVQRFKQVYNVKREGNWRGRNILNRIGVAYPQPEADEALLKRQRDLLLEARYRRARPQRDEKILADSNGMMIAALAHAGAAMNRPDWLAVAINAFDFVLSVLGEGDRLYHSWCAGKRHHIGFADDYAHMARAALMLWEAVQDDRFLKHAEAWTRILNEHFWDGQNGGYFFTADDSDSLIFRARMVFDQAAWSGNGVMVSVLSKLHFITTDQSYRERSNALIQAFSGELGRAYISMGSFVNGLENILAALQIVIVGQDSDPRTRELLSAVWGRSLPTATVIRIDPDKTLPQSHPAHGKAMQNGKPTAYVCTRSTCSAPITEPVILSQVLQLPARPAQGQA